MPNFLHRRASALIEEARGLAAAGGGREACRRLLATCELVERSFGRTHRELPELYQLLSDLHHGLDEVEEAARHQTRSWELLHLRARRLRRLLAVSGLAAEPETAAVDLDRWPPAVGALLEGLRGDAPFDPPPEVLAFGPTGSGKTRLLHVLGHQAIARPWPARLCPAYELLEILVEARRALRFRRTLSRLDRYRVLLVDELDPWSLTPREAEALHNTLLHRRGRRCTVLAIRTEKPLSPDAFLAGIRRTKGLRHAGPPTVLLALEGTRRDES